MDINLFLIQLKDYDYNKYKEVMFYIGVLEQHWTYAGARFIGELIDKYKKELNLYKLKQNLKGK